MPHHDVRVSARMLIVHVADNWGPGCDETRDDQLVYPALSPATIPYRYCSSADRLHNRIQYMIHRYLLEVLRTSRLYRSRIEHKNWRFGSRWLGASNDLHPNP